MTWSCTRDHVTEPCGDCDGCRQDQQAKANADAAFAVGALCGALGALGRPVLGARIQQRFEEVLAAQEPLRG